MAQTERVDIQEGQGLLAFEKLEARDLAFSSQRLIQCWWLECVPLMIRQKIQAAIIRIVNEEMFWVGPAVCPTENYRGVDMNATAVRPTWVYIHGIVSHVV